MRILMVVDFYHPYLGGLEQHVRTLSLSLVERGHDVAVATLWREGLAEFAIDQGVRVYRLRGSSQRLPRLFKYAARPWAPPVPDPELTWGLRRVVARERPEVVHGHDWLARSFLPLKGWSGAKLVVTLHYYTLTCAKKNLMHDGLPCDGPGLSKCVRCTAAHYGTAKSIPTLLGNWAAGAAERRAADMVLAVSRATADGNGLAGSKPPFQVIYNFIPDRPAPREDPTPYVTQLPDGDFLMFVGDLRREKGIGVLLQAYAQLAQAPPLVLIGKVWADTPATFPPGAVVFRDWPNYAVMEAWRRSAIALVPSLWPEPFGLVVIEAMGAGRAVVASRIGGIPEIVVDGETGLLVPPGDADALAAAMQRLLGDPALRERMGQAGLRRTGLFRASAVVPEVERVYAHLVGNTLSGNSDHGIDRTPGSGSRMSEPGG